MTATFPIVNSIERAAPSAHRSEGERNAAAPKIDPLILSFSLAIVTVHTSNFFYIFLMFAHTVSHETLSQMEKRRNAPLAAQCSAEPAIHSTSAAHKSRSLMQLLSNEPTQRIEVNKNREIIETELSSHIAEDISTNAARVITTY